MEEAIYEKYMKRRINKQNSVARKIPTTYVALTYDCLYDDYSEVDVHKLLDGIPTVCALNFIVKKFNEVAYALTNNTKQRSMLREMCNHITGEPRKRIWKFLNEHPHVVLVECYGTLLLEALALQNYTQIESGDDSLDLCEDEYEPVYKALLYCNQRWTNLQEKGLKNHDFIDISLLVDMPVVEFKYYKDFETQLYKSIQFFEFCEQDTVYSHHLSFFCSDHHVDNWREYVMRIFSMVEVWLRKPYVKVNPNHPDDIRFFDQYIVNTEDCHGLWEGNHAITYLRDHFLVKLSGLHYLLLNPNLLVDKFYQGMKFDFFRTLKKHHLTDSNNNIISNYADFSADFGTNFSEPYLLYTLMRKVFDGRVDVIYTGAQLKDMGVDAEPDLYMRVGDTLFLFEYKDVTLADNVKLSADAGKMKTSILDRVCKYEKGKGKKGAGQLHFTMENILLHHSLDGIDEDVRKVKKIFPIIMTTDRSFSALGVNAVVIKEYEKIMENHPIGCPVFISVPIIMDLDVIIKCANRLHTGKFDLAEMLIHYMKENNYNLVPFNTFVIDNYLCNHPFDEGNGAFLFGDFMERK